MVIVHVVCNLPHATEKGEEGEEHARLGDWAWSHSFALGTRAMPYFGISSLVPQAQRTLEKGAA